MAIGTKHHPRSTTRLRYRKLSFHRYRIENQAFIFLTTRHLSLLTGLSQGIRLENVTYGLWCGNILDVDRKPLKGRRHWGSRTKCITKISLKK